MDSGVWMVSDVKLRIEWDLSSCSRSSCVDGWKLVFGWGRFLDRIGRISLRHGMNQVFGKMKVWSWIWILVKGSCIWGIGHIWVFSVFLGILGVFYGMRLGSGWWYGCMFALGLWLNLLYFFVTIKFFLWVDWRAFLKGHRNKTRVMRKNLLQNVKVLVI
jgi:hypothetical protein